MFRAIGKITLNLILIFMVEDLVRSVIKRVQHRKLPGELV